MVLAVTPGAGHCASITRTEPNAGASKLAQGVTGHDLDEAGTTVTPLAGAPSVSTTLPVTVMGPLLLLVLPVPLLPPPLPPVLLVPALLPDPATPPVLPPVVPPPPPVQPAATTTDNTIDRVVRISSLQSVLSRARLSGPAPSEGTACQHEAGTMAIPFIGAGARRGTRRPALCAPTRVAAGVRPRRAGAFTAGSRRVHSLSTPAVVRVCFPRGQSPAPPAPSPRRKSGGSATRCPA